MIVPDARVALYNCQFRGEKSTGASVGAHSLFKIGGDRYVRRVELFAKVIGESSGGLWDRVADHETKVAGLGDSLRE